MEENSHCILAASLSQCSPSKTLLLFLCLLMDVICIFHIFFSLRKVTSGELHSLRVKIEVGGWFLVLTKSLQCICILSMVCLCEIVAEV